MTSKPHHLGCRLPNSLCHITLVVTIWLPNPLCHITLVVTIWLPNPLCHITLVVSIWLPNSLCHVTLVVSQLPFHFHATSPLSCSFHYHFLALLSSDILCPISLCHITLMICHQWNQVGIQRKFKTRLPGILVLSCCVNFTFNYLW